MKISFLLSMLIKKNYKKKTPFSLSFLIEAHVKKREKVQ